MAEKKLFSIESIVKRATIGLAGRPVDEYEITWVTKSGVRDTIRMPEADYTEAHVLAEVTRLSELHEKIVKG